MKASQAGIEVSKAELGALLFFAGGATKDGVVKFRVGASRKLVACSGDGKKSILVTADAGDADVGEWAMPADYLETVRRGINKGKTEAILEVRRGGHALARLRGAASKDKHTKIEDESNGTSTQLSIEKIQDDLENGTQGLEGSWFAFQPKNFSRPLAEMSKAAEGSPLTQYPPKEPTDHVCFEASCEGGRWRCKLPTAVVLGPGDEAPREEQEDDRPGQQQPLPGTGGKGAKAAASTDDGIVPDNYKPDGVLATQKAPRKKAAKKAGKKAPSKKAKKK